MFRKYLIKGVLLGGLAVFASAADVVVKVAPPHPIVETRPAAPGEGYVWTPGYHRWDGERYNWVGGRWERPPHPHATWVAHKWVKRNGGWVLVEGHWK